MVIFKGSVQMYTGVRCTVDVAHSPCFAHILSLSFASNDLWWHEWVKSDSFLIYRDESSTLFHALRQNDATGFIFLKWVSGGW